MAATLWLPLSCRSMRAKAEGKMIACARHHRARASAFSWAPQRFVGICGSTSTFLLVSQTTCWRRRGQCTSRERRKTVLAGARSLYARPRERRYRHAFGGWFERGRLNLRAGEEPFLRDRREVTEGVSGRFRRCGYTGTKRRNARERSHRPTSARARAVGVKGPCACDVGVSVSAKGPRDSVRASSWCACLVV